MSLTNRETAALDVLCDTFVPSLAFTKDEDPVLFSMSAADLGVSARVAEALDRIEPAKSEGFRLFLRLLENPLFIATVSSSATKFSRLSQAGRERVLQRLSRSVIPQLRSAFQGARSLVLLHAYAANGTPESSAILSAIGYEPGSIRKPPRHAYRSRNPGTMPTSNATFASSVPAPGEVWWRRSSRPVGRT